MTRLDLAVDPAHPAFAGHFPARAIVPGVVLLDQSLRAIVAHFGLDEAAFASTICRIGAAKFLSPVGPGEALRLEVDATCRPESASSSAATGVPTPASTTYVLRVFAGKEADERIAVTGTVSFELRLANATSTTSATSVASV